MLLGDRVLAWRQGVTQGEGTNSSTLELCVLHLNNMVGLPPLLGNKGMFLGTYSWMQHEDIMSSTQFSSQKYLTWVCKRNFSL